MLKSQNPVYGNMMPVVYPNPFVDKVDIVLNAEITGNYKLEMVDLMGSRIYTEDRNVSVASYQTYTLTDLGRVASGLYVVRITYPAGTVKLKILKY
jgi:hypothetical protein